MRVEQVQGGGEWWQPSTMPDVLVSVPDRLVVTVDDGSLPWDVRLVIVGDPSTEAHVVDEVTIRRRPGDGSPPASAAGIRHVPVGALLAEAVRRSARTWRITGENEDGTVKLTADSGTPNEDGLYTFLEPSSADMRLATEGRRRNAVDSDVCAGALELYEQAKAAGRPDPYSWVGAQLGIARSTAHKYVKQARAERGDR